MLKHAVTKSVLLLLAVSLSRAVFAQDIPGLLADTSPSQKTSQNLTVRADALKPPESMAPPAANVAAPSTVTIPAGTRVLMILKSPLHTTSGTAGSGLYLETLYPVIVENHVVIPARTLVQGVIEAGQRPGHLDRVSEFKFRFTTLIFANNYVASIQGALQSIPGARSIRTRDHDGTITTVDQPEKVVSPMSGAAVIGAIIGSHRAFGIGMLPGAGLGAGLGLGSVLLKRGDDINLAIGSRIEMVLQTPLSLEQTQIAENARYAAQLPAFDPPEPPSEPAKEKRQRPRRPVGIPGLPLLIP